MNTLHQEVILISQDYLGPAAERFIDRQISFHLEKEPTQLSKADLPRLIEWVKVSIAILTEDKEMVEDFTRRITKLVESS